MAAALSFTEVAAGLFWNKFTLRLPFEKWQQGHADRPEAYLQSCASGLQRA